MPPIPHLIAAYGKRASEISSSVTKEGTGEGIAGALSPQVGPDGTNIWAAATSGAAALAVHLLACLLARIWKYHEATSIWVELIERRKQQISNGFANAGTASLAAMMAAKQTFNRQELASWDASARSWLQTADSTRRHQHIQLMLIINNVRLPVNGSSDVYESALGAWKSALSAVDRLVQGIPQQVQDGAVLLGMSAWHLYPDMEVLGEEIKSIHQGDELLNDGILTVPVQEPNKHRKGVFWSLPLSRMRYYSLPVMSERHIASDTSRITIRELHLIVLGTILAQWNTACPSDERGCNLIISLAKLVDEPIPWLVLLANASQMFVSSSGLEKRHMSQLLCQGKRRCFSYLNSGRQPVFFGLASFSTFFSVFHSVEKQIEFMRGLARNLTEEPYDLILRYPKTNTEPQDHWRPQKFELASAVPRSRSSMKRTHDHVLRTTKNHFRLLPVDKHDQDTIDGEELSGCLAALPADQDEESAQVCRSIDAKLGYDCLCTYLGDPCSVLCHSIPSTCSNLRRRSEGEPHDLNVNQELLETGEDLVFIPSSNMVFHGDSIIDLKRPRDDYTTRYNFVFGGSESVALYKKEGPSFRGKEDHSSTFRFDATMDELEYAISTSTLSVSKLRKYLRAWWLLASWGPFEELEVSFNALLFATSIYENMPGATIDIGAVNFALHKSFWAQMKDARHPDPTTPGPHTSDPATLDPHYSDPEILASGLYDCHGRVNNRLERTRKTAKSFAFIAMFESGEFNVDPTTFKGVFALSTGDSIYVASALLQDPTTNPIVRPVSRVLGNLGRPEMVLLIPPSNSRLEPYDRSSSRLVNHDSFDGQVLDCFRLTSLHLSFTDFEMAVDIGNRGLRDSRLLFVEALISINHRSKHIGDIDILSIFASPYLVNKDQSCEHSTTAASGGDEYEEYKELVSIDSWEEFVDFPNCKAIFRASNNWQARIAAAAASAQLGRRFVILPPKPCLKCIADWCRGPPRKHFELLIS